MYLLNITQSNGEFFACKKQETLTKSSFDSCQNERCQMIAD